MNRIDRNSSAPGFALVPHGYQCNKTEISLLLCISTNISWLIDAEHTNLMRPPHLPLLFFYFMSEDIVYLSAGHLTKCPDHFAI